MNAIDGQGRCQHWHGPDDVLWLRLPCCEPWWPCRDCHDEAADHAAKTWPAGSDAIALRCGRCEHVVDVQTYLADGSACPACKGAFNPGCKAHTHLYFDDKPFKAAD